MLVVIKCSSSTPSVDTAEEDFCCKLFVQSAADGEEGSWVYSIKPDQEQLHNHRLRARRLAVSDAHTSVDLSRWSKQTWPPVVRLHVWTCVWLVYTWTLSADWSIRVMQLCQLVIITHSLCPLSASIRFWLTAATLQLRTACFTVGWLQWQSRSRLFPYCFWYVHKINIDYNSLALWWPSSWGHVTRLIIDEYVCNFTNALLYLL